MSSCSSERYTFHTEMQEVVEVEKEVEVYIGTDDHTQLKNLDAPDQHPIGSITNLKDELSTMNQELSKKMGEGNAMTNMDILDIINS